MEIPQTRSQIAIEEAASGKRILIATATSTRDEQWLTEAATHPAATRHRSSVAFAGGGSITAVRTSRSVRGHLADLALIDHQRRDAATMAPALEQALRPAQGVLAWL